MKMWSKCCSGLAALLTLTPSLWSQIPTPPPAPAAPVTAVPVVMVPPKKGLLEQCADLKARCKAAFCQSQLGLLVNNGLKPITALSGGLVPGCCPLGPSAADLAKPPDSAEGAAAQIKKSEAEAKARRAAVRYLGTVDCHWFPEAEAGLINALRGDTNECVRLEAALALGNGCCCTKKTITALTMTVSGSNKDGKPSENSERVKAAAMYALEHCLACYSEIQAITEPPKTPVEPPTPAPPPPPVERPTAMIGSPPSAYYQAVEKIPMKQLVEEARRTMAEVHNAPTVTSVHHGEDYSLFGMLTRAISTPSTPAESATPTEKAVVASASPAESATPTEKAVAASAAPPPPMNVAHTSATPTWEPKSSSASASPVVPGSANRGTIVNRDADTNRVQASATPMREPKYPPAPASSAVQSSTYQSRVVSSNSDMEAAGAGGTASSRLTSMISWQNSAVNPSRVSIQERPAPASLPEPRRIPVAQPMAGAPVTQSASPAGGVRIGEMRDPEFPLPGATRVTLDQLLAVLRKSTTIAQREWAAQNLAAFNAHDIPVVADMLLKAAREDSAPTVRAACVRSLMAMGVYSPSARATFQALKNDPDSRVQLEAEAALRNLGSN